VLLKVFAPGKENIVVQANKLLRKNSTFYGVKLSTRKRSAGNILRKKRGWSEMRHVEVKVIEECKT
jgi:hypothetical protein